ncbi:ornithine cyclodeaminase family protein [Chloroflexota bacterium]
MLLLNNDDVRSVLTMEITMEALEKSYIEMLKGEGVCRPRIDIRIPTPDPNKWYNWGTMEGGSASGYFAIRMKSDIAYYTEYEGARTQEKYCIKPGTYCGLVFLFSVSNAEPLAILNEGYLQHMRVGADAGLGAKYMARQDAEVVGMIGSGGMARSHIEAFLVARDIEKIQVYSPTQAHREAYAQEIEAKHGIEAVALDDPRDVYRKADIVAGCTDTAVPVIRGEYVEEGTHVTAVKRVELDKEILQKIDTCLRFGDATAPIGYSASGDSSLAYVTPRFQEIRKGSRDVERAVAAADLIGRNKVVSLKDILDSRSKGRESPRAITYSERGNMQGAQFHAVAGRVYEMAREKGIGREIPTEWFLQDIRD